MKMIPLLLLLLALSSPQKPRQVLADFRQDQTSAPPKISLAAQQAVLSKVFRRYLSDESRCNRRFDASSSSDPLAAARTAGQIVPLIAEMVTGSFTAPGQTQTAYVIFVKECNASHADNFGSKRVAIFSGQQLIANVDADSRGSIVRKTDLNGDGVDELLMASSYMGQGTLTEMAALVEFRNGRLRIIEDFGAVNDDSCASGSPGSTATASVISILDAEPGKMPKLRMDNYVSNCRNVKRWRFVSTGKRQD
jgi:hypothetical protein